MPPVADALATALAPARDAERPLVLFDTWERMTALGGYLRRELLPSLPAQAVVVIAGRRPPDPAWFEGGWDALCVELELQPLSDERVARAADRARRQRRGAHRRRSSPGPAGRRSR